jgi:hypothetical protein
MRRLSRPVGICEMTAESGRPSTVRSMTNPSRPTRPAELTVTLARQLASVPEVVPMALLFAACAMLRSASNEVLDEVRAHPRRRGNPAKRMQALSDARDLGPGLIRGGCAWERITSCRPTGCRSVKQVSGGSAGAWPLDRGGRLPREVRLLRSRVASAQGGAGRKNGRVWPTWLST